MWKISLAKALVQSSLRSSLRLVCLSGYPDVCGGGGIPKAEFLGPIRVSHSTSGFGSKHRDACTQRNWILWQAGPTSLHAACLADVCDTDRGCTNLWALAPVFLVSAILVSSACGQFSSSRPALPFSFRWRTLSLLISL